MYNHFLPENQKLILEIWIYLFNAREKYNVINKSQFNCNDFIISVFYRFYSDNQLRSILRRKFHFPKGEITYARWQAGAIFWYHSCSFEIIIQGGAARLKTQI